MEGRRGETGVTHIEEPKVFIEESVLIGIPRGEPQRCAETLLLVLHLFKPTLFLPLTGPLFLLSLCYLYNLKLQIITVN